MINTMKNKMELLHKFTIRKGDRIMGITWYDIENYILTPEQFGRFDKFMSGQTMGCVDDSCSTGVVYLGDLERFLRNEK